jgi:hypothetical protein
LIEAGANVNATHDRGYTVFMSAVGSGRCLDVLKMLIDAGADPHVISGAGYNAFHAAIDVNGEPNAEESVRETFAFLKHLGVDIELRNLAGHTPLARAILHGTGTETRVLCELGAKPNVLCPERRCRGDDCTTKEVPLLLIVAKGLGVHQDVKAEALLKAGADPEVVDEEGHSALAHAVSVVSNDASESEKTFYSFFQGLQGLPVPWTSMPRSREEFLGAVTPAVRGYAQDFSSKIPIRHRSQFDEQWRVERVSTIVSLCAYETWARHERRGSKKVD